MKDSLHLRAPEPDDLDVLYRWENDAAQWDNSLSAAMTSRFMLYNFLENYTDNIAANGQVRFMIDVEDGDDIRTIGTVDLCDYVARDRRAFVSIYIDAPYRGLGLGSAAIAAVKNVALHCYSLYQLTAIVAADNQTSLHVFENENFTRAGVIKQWLARGHERVDAVLMQCIL